MAEKIVIHNTTQAFEALQPILDWLEIDCPGLEKATQEYNEAVARVMATRILESAGCNGMGGCLLCQD